jgi:hypothetical protein
MLVHHRSGLFVSQMHSIPALGRGLVGIVAVPAKSCDRNKSLPGCALPVTHPASARDLRCNIRCMSGLPPRPDHCSQKHGALSKTGVAVALVQAYFAPALAA